MQTSKRLRGEPPEGQMRREVGVVSSGVSISEGVVGQHAVADSVD